MNDTKQLDGKVALVTGASSGIGEATARLLARHKAWVAGLGRTAEELDEAVTGIQESGGTIMSIVADITKEEEMKNAVRQIIDRWGRLDIVFANAGINGVWAPVEKLKPEEFRETIEVNLVGTFLTIKYAVPHLKKQGGAIVITSSVNGTRMFSNTGATAYSCSKGAQVVMAKMLALELAKHRIRVNAICPGRIDTQIEDSTEKRDVEAEEEPVAFPEGSIPLTDGQAGSSEQVAQLVLFLVSDASSHVTGSEMWIDGGQSLLKG
jgi:NAD(P)-dependent dehydrogenase (short-subunit alcohol dehydrogenase family)